MKTIIEITGQIGSIYTLRTIMNGYDSEIRGNFNNYYHLIYTTKKEALKAIAEAKKYLKNNDYDFSATHDSIRYDAGFLTIYNKTI
jgi:hypothetical protein